MAASMLLFLLVIARVVGLVRQARARRLARARPAQRGGCPGVRLDVGGDPRSCARDGDHPRRRGRQGAPVPRDPDRCRALHRRRAADRRLRGGQLQLAAGSSSGGPLGHDSRLQLEVPVAAACAIVFPIAAVNRRRGLIVVASSAPLSPLLSQALQSLADSVSLALGSAELDRGHAPARERSALRLARAQRERPHHGRRQRRDHRLPEPVDRAHPRLPPRRGPRNLVPGAADRRRSRPAGPAARDAAAWRRRNVHVRVHALCTPTAGRSSSRSRGPSLLDDRARPRHRAEQP